MTMNIGTLTIEMAANVARLKSDMDQAKNVVSDSMKQIGAAVNTAKSAFIAMTGVASVDALQNIVLGSIQSVAHLRDLSIQAGITVESLSGLAAVGKATGTSADQIAAASNKLSKALATANEESKGAATALKAIGLSFDDFQKLSPDERIQKVAVALSGYQDGSQKSAAAMLLFGKAGADMLPFLKDLATSGDLHAKVTKEQAESAHDFEVQMGRLKANGDAWKRSMSIELIPALNDLAAVLLTVRKNNADLGVSVGDVMSSMLRWGGVAVNSLIYDFKALGIIIGGTVAQFSALGEGGGIFSANGRAAWSAAGEAMREDLKNLTADTKKANYAMLGLTNSKAGAGRGGSAWSDPRSLGVGEDFKPQITGLDGDSTGGAGAAGRNAALSYLDSLKTKYEGLTGATSVYAEAERKLATIKDGVSPAMRKQIEDLAKLIDKTVDEKKARAELVKQIDYEIDQQKQAADAMVAANNAQNGLTQGYEFEVSLLGKTADEIALVRAQRDIDTKLRQAEVAIQQTAIANNLNEAQTLALLADAQGKAKDALEAYKKVQDDALDQKNNPTRGAKDAVKDYLDAINSAGAISKNVVTNAFKGMEDSLVNFVKTGKLDFKSLADSIITDLIRIQVQQSIMKPITEAASAFSLSSLTSLLGFANGGNPPTDTPSIVGENGPELFVPNTPGMIIPNHKLNGGGGVTVNQPIVINANNASAETVGQIRALMPTMIAENKRVVESVIKQAMARRGGSL